MNLRRTLVLLAFPVCAAAHALAPHENERLSDYLLRTAPTQGDYSFAGEWISPESQQAQAALHRSLLLAVSNVPSQVQLEDLKPEERQRWSAWLNSLQPRGRLRLPSFDARWLQANPRLDPLLAPTHQVHIPNRPTTVAVIRNEGGVCHVRHEPNRSLLDYAQRCGEDLEGVRWAYLIQPDGEVFRYGLSKFNESRQAPPAPGAWVWVPRRHQHWPRSFNQTLAQFLAGQGAAQAPSTLPVIELTGDTKPLAQYRDLEVSPSAWGNIGLLQTPSARFATAGSGSITFSHAKPYTRINVILTPFDWLEAGFRYVDISDRLYGPEIAGSQSLKDKSIDAKFRLLRERDYIPQIALGLRDLGGTGLFSGEYLVASKRFGPIDASLGLGWGYVGGQGNITNPLKVFGDKFKTRPGGSTGSNQGGDFNTNTYFRGPVALFGGVQYQTPWDRWVLKLEVDGNDYQREPNPGGSARRSFTVDSAVNVGAVYRLGPHSQFTLGFERGNTMTVGVSFGTNLGRLSTPKIDEPRPLQVQAPRRDLALANVPQEDWGVMLQALQAQTGWEVQSISRRARTLRVEITATNTFDLPPVIDRANGVLHALAPFEISQFTYIVNERGLPLAEFTVTRDDWAKRATSFVPPLIRLNQPAVIEEIVESKPVRKSVQDEPLVQKPAEQLAGGIGLHYQQSLGGPDAFILFQLSAQAEGEWRPRPNSWVTGIVRAGLIDNYDKFKYTAPSNLPRVRTFIREFLTSSDVTMPLLQATHTARFGDNLSASVYGGYLEAMYAGVGGELLYKPFGSSYALGFDVNRVRQRDFKQNFSLRDYDVTTGHATLYWHTGWEDILAKISAGQYLAGDRGVTVDLSRVFGNGVRIGAFATKTNVSAEEFGEGSFDKGIYVTIPFDAMMTKYSKSEALLQWQPLTRDGGARLDRRFQLYDMTRY